MEEGQRHNSLVALQGTGRIDVHGAPQAPLGPPPAPGFHVYEN